ncbi:MAG TPA: hypothetical protein VM841_00285 [Actinomycetota bacterium]|nr:hypothetical protein [Actinomycetota bacterium]
MSQQDFVPAFQVSGGQDPDLPPPPPEPAPEPFAPPEPPPDPKTEGRAIASLTAKVKLLGERIAAQETLTARMSASMERVESSVAEHTKRTQPMLETLSAELARQGAMIESIKTDTESSLDLHAQRVSEFEARLATVLREMRELVASKIESYDIAIGDRLEEARHAVEDQLATFEERVEDLVRRFAAAAIPDEMRDKVEDLSGRFIHAETALAATRSSVEFLRAEVGSLTMLLRKLAPDENV